MFEDNLHNVYKEIFYLVKDVGFDADYIERLTPAERKIFWLYHKEDEEEKAKSGKGEQYQGRDYR